MTEGVRRVLFLLRHAKASWDGPGLADKARPLNHRGRREAARIGREMAERGFLPDQALVSPALRTRETFAILSDEVPPLPDPDFPEELYAAPPDVIASLIRRTSPDSGSLLVVGHNPGLARLALALAGNGSPAESVERMRKKFPTAALARFELDGGWPDLGVAASLLTDFIRPKDLG